VAFPADTRIVNQTIQTRIFLVGCLRSGTTLLQSLLAANSYIASYPESHFYEKLFSRRRLLSAIGVSSRGARPRWNAFLKEIGHPEMDPKLSKYAMFVNQFSVAFIEVLDALTIDQGKAVWLEKTPGHLRYVDQIEELVNSTRFVHILRNGKDNIASLFEAGKKYPNEFWGHWYGTLDQCIQRWITDARISARCLSRKNHYLVRYEQLIVNPKPVLVDLCFFLGVPFDESMLSNYPVSAKHLILKQEQWKSSVFEPINPNGRSKFNGFLNEEQRKYILAHIPEDLVGYLDHNG
jgi:hypothetical protein